MKKDGLLLRVAHNMGWLIGGKLVGALLSLFYLAVAARVLGIDQFGIFAIVLAFGQAVANLVQFQSSQLVIRFGAAHMAAEKRDNFAALIGFSTLLDVSGALLSALIGYALSAFVGKFFGWDAEIVRLCQWFSLSLVCWLRATPTGVLRLLGRFDQLSLGETMTPVVRFIGAFAALIWTSSVGAFLLIWAVSELVASLTLWALAARELKRAGFTPTISRPRRARLDNPGLWRFAFASNALASLNLVWQQLGTLAVGGVVGTAAAGGYRLAFQFAQALTKPAMLLSRVIYPELAHLSAAGQARMAIWQSTAAASLAGVAMVVLTLLFGKTVLALVAGAEYASAAPLLVILSISAAIDLAGFALEPTLLAAGRAGMALLARLAGAGSYLLLLSLYIDPYGAHGVAWSAVIGSLITLLISLVLTQSAAGRKG